MAEVPEVETLVRDLRAAVVGRTIIETEVLQPSAVRFPTPEEFTTLLTDRLVLDAQRRAKYMLLPLSGDLLLTIHLALWGSITLVPTEQPRLLETVILWGPRCWTQTSMSMCLPVNFLDGAACSRQPY